MLRFAHFQKLIRANVIEQLFGTARPENFYRRLFCGAQAEVKPFVACAEVAAGGSCETSLAVHAHARAVAIAIAVRTSQSNREPMATGGSVEKQHRRTAESGQNNIHKTIVIDVAERGAACSNRRRHTGIGAFEMAVMIQREQRQFLISQRSIDLLNVIEDVALGNEKILPAVVVEIFQAHAPAGTARSKSAEASLQALIGESASAVVVIQAVEFARQNGDDYIGTAIVIVVLKNRAHAGKPFAIGGQRGTRFQSTFIEGSIAIVVEKILLHAVIRNKNVGEAVAIVVGERNAKSLSLLRGKSCVFANVFECAVTAIPVEKTGGGRKRARRTISVPVTAANFIVIGVPLHVAGHK